MSTFDADQFLNQTTDQAASTAINAFPDGDYIATIEDVAVRTGVIGKGDRKGEAWVSLDVRFKLQDLPGSNLEEIAESIARTDRLISQGFFLDITEGGAIDMAEGRNVKLGRLREAVRQNMSGQPWSPLMLKGAGPLVVRVIQKPDDDDPEILYNRITRTVEYNPGAVAA